jgi:type II secretory pathway predicted ATPase ExeA/septal ring-binding cell division protein DamX
MYLEHFGLNEPPFKITPVTDFFFSGANRGEILDALVYAITDGEGIVKISGEVGSGKTMLCRMLLDKLPVHIKAIYLANPSLSRDELLYAIADRLGLNLEGQRVNVILQSLQNDLESKYGRGERCVVLVDEAHAMPLETLEELRLLYNLQVGKHKLLQIVLFGQPELDEKLAQTNMRQLKDRIVHHFTILPLSQKVIHSYLMFRMRKANYKGPDIFSTDAEKLIGKASHGLMRRVNVLADKSLLAAFVENTHLIEARHVQAAIRDSEMTPMHQWMNRKNIAIVGGLVLLAGILMGAGWLLRSESQPKVEAIAAAPQVTPTISAEPSAASIVVAPITPAPIVVATTAPAAPIAQTPTSPITTPVLVSPAVSSTNLAPETAKATPKATPTPPAAKPSAAPTPDTSAASYGLLQQRLDATRQVITSAPAGSASIQLYYTENVTPARMEGFLGRAQQLGVLDKIYILPIKLHERDAFRVLYGIYANSEEARIGIAALPQRYQDAFAPTLHLLDN